MGHGHCLKGCVSSIRSVMISVNKNVLVPGSYEKSARVWDIAKGRVMTVFVSIDTLIVYVVQRYMLTVSS